MNIAEIIGKNIETVIKENSISLEECSNIIGVTRQTLNKYIKGENAIDSAKLFKLSRYFNKPLKFFLSPSYDNLSFMFREENPKKNFTPKDYNFVNSKFNQYFDIICMASLNKMIVIPESYKIKISAKLVQEDKALIREIAEKERRNFDIVSSSPSEFYYALEKRNINILSLEYDNLNLDAISAYSESKGAFIFINDNKAISEERKLFSLVHEYAHLVLHRDLYSTADENMAYSNSRSDMNEKVANLFASYFLIPRNILKEEAKIYRGYIDLKAIYNLKKKFGVSAQELLLALNEEKIITTQIYNYLNKKLEDIGFSNKEPQPMQYEDKNEKLYYILKGLYLDEKITSNMISEVLNLDIISTRKLLKDWELNGYEKDNIYEKTRNKNGL